LQALSSKAWAVERAVDKDVYPGIRSLGSKASEKGTSSERSKANKLL